MNCIDRSFKLGKIGWEDRVSLDLEALKMESPSVVLKIDSWVLAGESIICPVQIHGRLIFDLVGYLQWRGDDKMNFYLYTKDGVEHKLSTGLSSFIMRHSNIVNETHITDSGEDCVATIRSLQMDYGFSVSDGSLHFLHKDSPCFSI